MSTTPIQAEPTNFLQSRRGRIILENITAYIFVSPALLLIFLFGIFPVIFAFFMSLYRWRRNPVEYRGLDNYQKALGELSYVSFFGFALLAGLFVLFTAWRYWKETGKSEKREWLGFSAIVPGAALTAATYYFIIWFFEVFPEILRVPQRILGKELTRQLFIDEFFNSFTFSNVTQYIGDMQLSFVVAIALSLIWPFILRTSRGGKYTSFAWLLGLGMLATWWLMQLTLSEVDIALEEARADGTELPIWVYTIMILSGVIFLAFAWWLWSYSVHNHVQSDRLLFLRLLAVVAALVGAVMLIMELPPSITDADRDVLQGFRNTVFYSLFSVPLQLSLGLTLAVVLFQNIKGKSFFRVMFFMPYVTPLVATSVAYTLIFSHSDDSPANRFLTLFGIETQNWLREPKGIFYLIFGEGIPEFLYGPSLALFVIILYNVWIFAGYSTVIFLAGLGNIPEEVYDAAKIDGANSWQQFRHITLPLLSPTTFFLVLIATIGTFQAFTQVFLMRQAGAYDSVDTINLHIYNEITKDIPNYGYGSAMAFVLFGVILTLTLFMNRIAGRRVFYG